MIKPCRRPHPWRNLLAAVGASLAWAAGVAQAATESEITNSYATGADVTIDAPVTGDLFAAAGRVSVEQPVSGDAVLAAGSVEIRSRIGDDLRAAGGIVIFTGRVSGEALIAGGKIAFGPDAEILGRARLAGGDITVGGHLAKGLQAYGKNILVIGTIDGPVRLMGERIELLASARINGDITYVSDQEIMVDPRAQVNGRITRTPGTFEFPRPGLDIPGLPALRPLLFLGLLVAGALLLALFPRFTIGSLQTVEVAPLKSLGLGTAIFFSAPPVILLLFITIIGIPIALALAATYALALLLGYLVTAFYVGDRLRRAVRKDIDASYGGRILSLLAALVLLWLVRNIPYAGGFVVLLTLIAGLGAMALQVFTDYSRRA